MGTALGRYGIWSVALGADANSDNGEVIEAVRRGRPGA